MERDQASKFVNDLLRLMVSRNGSDLFLTADFPPAIKVDGKVTKVSPQPLTGQHTLALTRSVMNDKQAAEFERTKECNFAVAPQGIGRFRVNAFVQQGNVGLVMRTIPQTLPTIDSMNLPQILKIINGDALSAKLANETSALAKLLKKEKDDAKVIEELFLRFHGRKPTVDQLKLMKDVPADQREDAFRDLVWALVNSKEFLLRR